MLLAALILLAPGCLGADPEPFVPLAGMDESLTQLPTDAGAVKFLVLGDWGRRGRYFQDDVADEMGTVAQAIGANFVVTVGDNFYPSGVRSTQDSHWRQSFENVYTDSSLMIPWYVTLGNHDYRGNVQAQVDYTKLSDRWTLPARYYTVVKDIDDTTSVRFVFLDTLPLYRLRYEEVEGVEDVESEADRQLAWADSVLTVSTSQWNIVVGHHPIYAAGRHGESEVLVRVLKPLLESHNVQAYLAGHDHNLEYLYDGGPVHYFVSGGGSRLRRIRGHRHLVYGATRPGFLVVSMASLQMLAQFVDYRGNVLYGVVVDRRRQQPVEEQRAPASRVPKGAPVP